ncbi:MAG: hypothetical protein IJD80_00060, partial [Oscillospiraceae bacterium]|nr:hypothetical protein [Oscillospiraceae bacterium]
DKTGTKWDWKELGLNMLAGGLAGGLLGGGAVAMNTLTNGSQQVTSKLNPQETESQTGETVETEDESVKVSQEENLIPQQQKTATQAVETESNKQTPENEKQPAKANYGLADYVKTLPETAGKNAQLHLNKQYGDSGMTAGRFIESNIDGRFFEENKKYFFEKDGRKIPVRKSMYEYALWLQNGNSNITAPTQDSNLHTVTIEDIGRKASQSVDVSGGRDVNVGDYFKIRHNAKGTDKYTYSDVFKEYLSTMENSAAAEKTLSTEKPYTKTSYAVEIEKAVNRGGTVQDVSGTPFLIYLREDGRTYNIELNKTMLKYAEWLIERKSGTVSDTKTEPAAEQRQEFEEKAANENTDDIDIGNTKVNDNPDTHTPEEMKVIDEFKNAVDADFVDYIQRARTGEYVGNYTVTKINSRTEQAMRELTGLQKVGSKIVVNKSTIEHIDKKHGKNGKSDMSMSNDEDIARMKYVIDNFDHAYLSEEITKGHRLANGEFAPKVLFTKKVNGTYVVVEAVSDGQSDMNTVTTAFFSKNGIIPGKIKEEWNASKAKSEKSQLADRRLKPLDSSSSNSNVTQKNIKSQEKVSLPENSLDKYVESLSPMQKASVKKTLSVELKDDNGQVITRAKWVEDKISQDGN